MEHSWSNNETPLKQSLKYPWKTHLLPLKPLDTLICIYDIPKTPKGKYGTNGRTNKQTKLKNSSIKYVQPKFFFANKDYRFTILNTEPYVITFQTHSGHLLINIQTPLRYPHISPRQTQTQSRESSTRTTLISIVSKPIKL